MTLTVPVSPSIPRQVAGRNPVTVTNVNGVLEVGLDLEASTQGTLGAVLGFASDGAPKTQNIPDLAAQLDAYPGGAQQPFLSVSTATAANIAANVSAVRISSASYLNGGPMHVRRPVGSGPASNTRNQSADGRWWEVDTSSIAYMCSPAEPRVGSFFDRAWVAISVPNELNYFSDNVGALQNCTVGGPGGDLSGNAAWCFLDNTGIERGAIGYSRNGLTTISGYVPDIVYVEVGNPFNTDEAYTNFQVRVTIAEGSAYWEGEATAYSAFQVESRTGTITLRNPNPAVVDSILLGLTGEVPNQIGHAMTTTKGRWREGMAQDAHIYTVNDYAIGNGSIIGQDNVALASWRVRTGGASGECYSISRAPAGSTLQSQYVEAFRIAADGRVMVGQSAASSYADGQVAVTSQASGRAALTIKGDASSLLSAFWSPGTSGDNPFIWFGTEASFTLRGSISYNRSVGVTDYNTTSDYRAKNVLGPVEDARDRVMAARPHRVRMHEASQDIVAFVAHEFALAAPWAVTGEKDAVDANGNPIFQQVNYAAAVPLLWEDHCALRDEVEALTAEVATLKAAA